ncbi:hypothetical protein [Dactylosporangium sp. NPDC048998]|uniref:hypothetical protein n=1 Tax=Dactylosporangium sp. NPDC048998 TaxID=3363976 RepID=UPI00371730D9
MPNRMRRAAERTLRRHAREHLDTDPADGGDPAEPPALLGPGGERLDPAALLDRRGERLWLLTAPGTGGPGPLPWLLRAAWARAAADPAVAQRPVLVDLARLAAEGPVTAAEVLRAVTGPATEHGCLVLLAGLDDAGGAVRAAVAGLPAPLARAAPASTIVTLSHAEPVPGFHIPAVVLQDAPPHREAPVDDGVWDGLAGRLRTQQPWPAGLLADAVAACAAAPEPLRWRIIDDLTMLADRRLLFRAALAAGACDDDGVRRAARTEIESLAGTAPAARDARWLSRLLALLPVLDAGAPAATASDNPAPSPRDPSTSPAARAVLLRMAATGRPWSAPLTLLARRDPAAAIAAAERSGDPLALDAVAGAADEPAVARAVLGRCAAVPGWEPALVYRAQLDRGVATALLAERDRDAGPVAAGRWRGLAMTRGTVYGRLLDDVLTRPWGWPPHAAPLLFTLAQVRPPASVAPIAVAALPRAGTGAVAATLAVLACARLAGGHIGPPVATLAVLAGLTVAGALLVRRLRQWQAAVAAGAGGDGGDGGAPVPVRRENVLAAVLGAGPAVRGIAPGAGVLDAPLRRACIRAGVPQAEITHLLGALAARRARLGGAVAPAVPEQAFPMDEREPNRGG